MVTMTVIKVFGVTVTDFNFSELFTVTDAVTDTGQYRVTGMFYITEIVFFLELISALHP